MIGVITSNEPKEIRDLLPDLVVSPMDFDILLYTNYGPVTIERKRVPVDFINSITDGRFHREIQAMRQESKINIVLLHGEFQYYNDGRLFVPGVKRNTKKKGGWNKEGIENSIRTLQYTEGIFIEQATDDNDFVKVLNSIQSYFDDRAHTSMQGRESMRPDFITPIYQDRVKYFYMGLPGVSHVRASNLIKVFDMPEKLFNASLTDIKQVDGFGDVSARKIYEFLHKDIDKLTIV